MARKFREVSDGKLAIVDIICDMCSQSTRTLDGYEKGTLCASFDEGWHAGDRFVVDLCQNCFDELLHHVIIEKMGTCVYVSEIEGVELDMDDLRELYAHMGAGTLVLEEEDFEDQERTEED